ncbi:hypothetical protein O3M35_007758 [Rhynocoris fuscipes]|uniref:Gustatory receptor n=1 Tax=Rhynocoris fuscipes TaxID=488301 RepID=A0AAW1DB59_9HEMI
MELPLYITWLFWSIIFVWYPVSVCSQINSHNEKFNRMLRRKVYSENESQFANYTKVKLYFLNNDKIKFTAFAMFDMNVRVMFNLIATTATCIVILLQLDSLLNEFYENQKL